MGFFRQEYWSGLSSHSPGDLLDPGMELMSPSLAGVFFTIEPPGKPKNPGVGSLSLLQGNFPTQESNWRSPELQVDSLPAELPGKPIQRHNKN